MSKNVILTDFDVNESWDYKNAIEEDTAEVWEIEKFITNQYHGSKIKTIIRYVLYFVFSFKIFLRRKRYEKVIAWQQFYGLLLAFFCKIFHVKKAPKIYVMTFIYKPKNTIYKQFMKYIVKSGYITKLIVLSEEERHYYSVLFNISEELFYCTRIGVPDISNEINANFATEKYYLSVGRSNRDYKFLRNAWKREFGKLIIICDSYREEEKEGIVCLNNCYGREYLQYVADCYAQIIPLSDINISSGSLTFLQAMMLSKPSIVTENVTVHDYIDHKINGLIIEKNESDLEEAINYMNNQENYNSLCRNARKSYEQFFGEYSLGKSIARMLKNNQ